MLAGLALFALAAQHPCAGCHPRHVEGYLATGMGRSAGRPAGNQGGVVDHRSSQSRFVIEAASDGMRHRVERPGSQAEFPVSWFIGSGNRGSSYLIERDGRLFQSPVSWYTQRRKWDLSPGYDKDARPDFSREVTGDCLFCHTSARVEPIGCERCHGPAERHLSRPARDAIVNPARLAPRARDSVCEQCHLGGQARIPNPGRGFSDFQPGDLLEDAFTVYVGGESKGFQVVSHVEQLAQSRCAKESGDRMWCGSCHDPHGKPANAANHYRQRCLACHDGPLPASHPNQQRDCAGCHMPKREAWDGGHTAFTDHRIQRRSAGVPSAISSPLRAWREPDAVYRERNLGLAHVSIGERDASMSHLDEGYRLLSALRNPDAAVETALGLVLLRKSRPIDAVTHFERAASSAQGGEHRRNLAVALREAAESLFRERRFVEAARALDRYVAFVPGDFNARLLRGLALQQAGELPEAEEALRDCTVRQPRNSTAWFSLARVRYLRGKLAEAERNVLHSLELGEPAARVHNLAGLIRAERGEHAAALRSYDRAVESRMAGFAEPHLNAGVLLLQLGRTRDGLERLNRAAAIQPASSEILYHRARALLEVNDSRAAERDLEAAAGDHEGARRLLAQLRAGGVGAASIEPERQPEPPAIRFRDVAETAGIRFVHRNHATPQKHLIETMAGGIAVFDYNNDGRPDIYFTNGAAIPSLAKDSPAYWNRLYRNDGEWRFTDVTAEAGVAAAGYSMGAAAGDFDNDGRVDLFVAGYRRNLLYRNLGNGRFEDVTARSGIRSDSWSVAGGWFDFDQDGHLDLFVVNYLDYALQNPEFCGDAKAALRVYCHPSRFRGLPNTLYRNLGNGTFEDVSAKSGIGAHVGKGMSVAFADYDLDGDQDVFVTNDTEPNFLFRNRGDGAFDEVGMEAGVALTDDGKAISSMGVDWRDYDNDGLPDIVVTALAGESFPLFRNQGKGFFRDFGAGSRLTALSLPHSGWGVLLADFNNDGWKDLFTANSHVTDNIESYSHQRYREPNSVFANRGDGRFVAGEPVGLARAHRGAAAADFDGDGLMDVVVSSLGAPAELWRNESNGGRWIAFRLRGSRGNRDGIGARVRVGSQWNVMTSSAGYASSSLTPVHFGLGPGSARLREVEVIWSTGVVQTLKDLETGRVHLLDEPGRVDGALKPRLEN